METARTVLSGVKPDLGNGPDLGVRSFVAGKSPYRSQAVRHEPGPAPDFPCVEPGPACVGDGWLAEFGVVRPAVRDEVEVVRVEAVALRVDLGPDLDGRDEALAALFRPATDPVEGDAVAPAVVDLGELEPGREPGADPPLGDFGRVERGEGFDPDLGEGFGTWTVADRGEDRLPGELRYVPVPAGHVPAKYREVRQSHWTDPALLPSRLRVDGPSMSLAEAVEACRLLNDVVLAVMES